MAETATNKITRLEVQMSNIEQKVDAGFIEIKAVIRELSLKVDTVNDLKNEIAVLHDAQVAHVKQTSEEIDQLKKSNNIRRWVYPTLSAIVGSIMTFLILNFLENVRK